MRCEWHSDISPIPVPQPIEVKGLPLRVLMTSHLLGLPEPLLLILAADVQAKHPLLDLYRYAR